MSRWLEQYENHPYATSWQTLNEVINKKEIDEKTNQTDTQELVRLRKVFNLLDSLISTLDPDLVPLSTWKSFQTESDLIVKDLNQFITDSTITHLENANNRIDKLFIVARPYIVAEGDAAIALRDAAIKSADQINEGYSQLKMEVKSHSEKIELSKEEANTNLIKITKAYERIEGFEKLVFGDGDTDGLEQKIKKLISDTEDHREKINQYHLEILVGNEEEPAIKQQIALAQKEVTDDRNSINKLLSEASEKIEKLKEFYATIFGDVNSDKASQGLAEELKVRKDELKHFEKEQKKRYQALNDELNTLLPGATNAGLASAYYDMKISFDDPIRNASMLFYSSIAILMLSSFLLSVDSFGGDSWIKFTELSDWDSLLKSLIYKLPFYGPILWLAFYASKRRSEYQRLQQEYAHKEALAKSYQSYKQQIEALKDDNDEMLKGLLTKSIETIAYNVSETLDKKHGDKMPIQEILENTTNGVRNK